MDTEYKPFWDTYMTIMEDDDPASFYIDLGLNDFAPVKNLNRLLKLSIVLKNPSPDGLCSNEESGILFQAESTLITKLQDEQGAVFAGRTTLMGERVFYFYFPHGVDAEAIADKVMEKFPVYGYTPEISDDPEWEEYFDFLFPEDEELCQIINRRVIYGLQESGDLLTAPRRIEHWIDFSGEQDRDFFITEANKNGFLAGTKSHQPENENPYSLMIYREDKPDEQTINEITSLLMELAEDNNGTYDRWETKVVK